MAARDTGGGRQHVTRREDDEAAPVEETGAEPTARDRQEKLSEDVDAILDEIDEVLEENAEEFVRGYVQKGGQ